MTIIGLEGGIGTGKTLSLVYLGMQDLTTKKRLYSNVKLRNIEPKLKKKITYLTKDKIKEIFTLIKEGQFDMMDSTVLIQEAHNYMDSRSSMSLKNKTLTYWILQSRHTGAGTCDIIYDTQDFGQVDLRLRRNTDMFIRPLIMSRASDNSPVKIKLYITQKLFHKESRSTLVIDVFKTLKYYDTHEVVDFL